MFIKLIKFINFAENTLECINLYQAVLVADHENEQLLQTLHNS